jgi:hypothetical protein
MMLTCKNCNAKQPLTDDDIVNFYPRFFCLCCAQKLPFEISPEKLQQLFHSNDRSRLLTEDLSALPPAGQIRKMAADVVAPESNG